MINEMNGLGPRLRELREASDSAWPWIEGGPGCIPGL